MKKHFAFSCILFLFQLSSFAQQIEWEKRFGGNGSDRIEGPGLIQTNDRGYLLAGYSDSNISGEKTNNSRGGNDYWVIRIDSIGNIVWQKTIGGNLEDQLKSVCTTSDGGFLLGGYSNSVISGDKTEASYGLNDYWIVKIDSLGNIVWQKTFGGAGSDNLWDLNPTSDGGFILGGSSNSNASGNKTENSNGDYDYWVIKLDSLGSIIWQNTIGGLDEDFLNSLQQTDDGGYILGGSSKSDSTGDKNENRIGGFYFYDYWIVKLDSTGNLLWQNTIGGNSDELLCSVKQTIDKGYIIGGRSSSAIFGDKTEACYGLLDYWVVKTDSLGQLVWQNTIGGSKEDWLLSLKQTNDSGYILGGRSDSNISGKKTEQNLGWPDYWIVKLSSNGNMEWQNTIGGNEPEWCFDVIPTNDNGYLLGGFSGSGVNGDKNEICLGYSDIWIVKLKNHNNLATGKVFVDFNNSATYDNGDLLLGLKKINEASSTSFCFSEQNGHYTFAVYDSGNYSFSPSPISYYNSVPSAHNVYFSGINQKDSLNDFAFQAAGVYNDLSVQLTPASAFRPGFNSYYAVNFQNFGTTTINGTVVFKPDSVNTTYISSSLLPNSISQDSIVWNIGQLTPFQKGVIWIKVYVDSNTIFGTVISSGAKIFPLLSDADQVNNSCLASQIVTGSYDPNNIFVDIDTLLNSQLSNPPFLEYLINFQNTGNDTAFNVKILNPIDTSQFNISSFEFVNSSHPLNIVWKSWENSLEFSFPEIFLADSNTNELTSHGFIRYRIKPKNNLVVGTDISQKAFIYFDYNVPVPTNTAVTSIVLPTGKMESVMNSKQAVKIMPNPLTNKAILEFSNPEHNFYSFSLIDVTGRIIEQKSTTSNKLILEKEEKPEGVYFFQLNCRKTNVILNGKIIIGK